MSIEIPYRVVLPGTGPLVEALTRRDAEIAASINFVGWRDLVGGIEVRAAGATPQWSEITGMSGMYAYSFSATVEQSCWVVYHIDHDIYTGPGSKIYLHTHWMNAAATPNTGNVRWGFQWTMAKGHQQQAFPATQTVYALQSCSATRYMHHIAEISLADALDATAIEPDTLLMVRIFRDADDDADTCSDAVYLLLADCHYLAYGGGSTQNKAPNFYKS